MHKNLNFIYSRHNLPPADFSLTTKATKAQYRHQCAKRYFTYLVQKTNFYVPGTQNVVLFSVSKTQFHALSAQNVILPSVSKTQFYALGEKM